MYCLNLMRIALELALHNHVYEDIATKFFEHFLYIAEAMTNIGGAGHRPVGRGRTSSSTTSCNLPDGAIIPLKVRSMVGLIPLFAVETLEPELLDAAAGLQARGSSGSSNNRPDLAQLVSRWQEPGLGERRLLSLLRGHRMKKLLQRMLDETEFLSRLRRARALASATSEQPVRLRLHGGHGSSVELPAGRVRHRPVRRQLQLARADLVPGQLPDHRVAAEVPPLLRRRLQGRVPDRLGQVHHDRAKSPRS